MTTNHEPSLEPNPGPSLEPKPERSADKVGKALNDQRFQMLEDIAKELKSVVVFPTYFDAALRLRMQ